MRSKHCLELSLYRIWLITFILCFNVYLIYTTIRDYIELKRQFMSFNSSILKEAPGPMNFQLSCLICSLALLPLIIVTLIIPTGNLSNDNHVLGQDIDNNEFIFDSDSKGRLIRIDTLYRSNSRKLNRLLCCENGLLKQQFLPISVFLQIVSGLCFVIPIPFLESQKIQNSMVHYNSIWHTDLDFLVDQDNSHRDFMMFTQWYYRKPMSPAFFYLLFSLSLLTFRYPTVFWRTNRCFCLTFCLSLLIFSIHIAVDYCSICILIKLAYNKNFISTSMLPKLSPCLLITIYVTSSLIILLTQITLFNYGLSQYFDSLSKHRHNLRIQFRKQQQQQQQEKQQQQKHQQQKQQQTQLNNIMNRELDDVGDLGVVESVVVVDDDNEVDINSIDIVGEEVDITDDVTEMRNTLDRQQDIGFEPEDLSSSGDSNDTVSSCRFSLQKYSCTICALAFGTLGLAIKTPILMDNTRILSKTGDKIMYMNVVSAILVSVFWLLLWFALTLHNRWNFRVTFSNREKGNSGISRELHAHHHHHHYLCNQANGSVSAGAMTTSTLPTCSTKLTTNPASSSTTAAAVAAAAAMAAAAGGYSSHPGSPIYATCHTAAAAAAAAAANESLGVGPNYARSTPRRQHSETLSPLELRKSMDSNEGTDLSSCYNYVFLHNGSQIFPVNNSAVGTPINYPSIVKMVAQPKHSLQFSTPIAVAAANKTTVVDSTISGILCSEEVTGSEKSFGSNISRSMTLQDRTTGSINSGRYYTTTGTGNRLVSSNQPIAVRGAPMISYQIAPSSSYESSPINKQQPQQQFILQQQTINNRSTPISVINPNSSGDPFDLMESDILSHRLITTSAANTTMIPIENEYDAVESSSSIVNNNNLDHTITIKSNDDTINNNNNNNNNNINNNNNKNNINITSNDDNKIDTSGTNNYCLKLSQQLPQQTIQLTTFEDVSEDEEERLFSQV